MREIAFVVVFLVAWYGGLILAGVKPAGPVFYTDGVSCCTRMISTLLPRR